MSTIFSEKRGRWFTWNFKPFFLWKIKQLSKCHLLFCIAFKGLMAVTEKSYSYFQNAHAATLRPIPYYQIDWNGENFGNQYYFQFLGCQLGSDTSKPEYVFQWQKKHLKVMKSTRVWLRNSCREITRKKNKAIVVLVCDTPTWPDICP